MRRTRKDFGGVEVGLADARLVREDEGRVLEAYHLNKKIRKKNKKKGSKRGHRTTEGKKG